MQKVQDAFSEDAFRLRLTMIKECRKLLEKHNAKVKISEEYALAIVEGYDGSAEQFLSHDREIVRFLKSEPLPLHKNEIAHSLQNQITYGENDLIFLDWDGAFVFQQDGKTDSIVDLLQFANLHLLQYRMLDEDLARRLHRIDSLIRTKKISHIVFWNRELARVYKEVISLRATSIVEFDSIIREIKLIGDWYSARLYETAACKFRLEGWRNSIKEKLATLEDAYDIVSQNFRISKEHFFELMLQMGWLALILLELYHILR
ncbi:MAG: hypothetical protein HOO67_03710 [Candidatus Peribacteraceae bacterium]|nr:hypothetical protein [Candidatus Peribacteraceae bacterium]